MGEEEQYKALGGALNARGMRDIAALVVRAGDAEEAAWKLTKVHAERHGRSAKNHTAYPGEP